MRLLAALVLVVGTSGAAWAQSPVAAEVRALASRYHEDPARIDTLRAAMSRAAESDPQVENLLALAQIAFLAGDIRATTTEDKLAAYEQGRQAARRAAEAAPRNPRAHFWYATNAGRWGQTKGVLRSLFLLPEVKRGMETALELDPRFPPAYVLAGTVYYEVPGLFGGDLEKSEALFRRGLEVDPRFTGLHLGLARTLIKRGRIAEARRELEAVLGEKAPANLADWTLKDAPQARALLASLEGRS
ncbi:MAG TPA: tetratricopeptide repeat protein [Verrucomicrobiae bacterium]|jgi:tetratricopeptide (TPR) repeat protein|nr:tetratricopeptide repeat protein [Verrucomicrobiae bacterium]